MNIPVDYDDEVERKATHPKLLDKVTDYEILPRTRNKPKANPSAVHRSVLGNSPLRQKQVSWSHEQVGPARRLAGARWKPSRPRATKLAGLSRELTGVRRQRVCHRQ